MLFSFSKISDDNLIVPAIITIFNQEEKRITTTELIKHLRKQLILKEDDLKKLKGRSDDLFSQKVRNIKSHKTLEKLNLIYEVNGYICLTEHGKKIGKYLLENLSKLELIKDQDVENLKDLKNLFFQSSINLSFDSFFLNKIDNFDFSSRSLNIFKSLNINYVGDLVILNENDILKQKNAGKKTLNEINDFLKINNCKFNTEIENWNLENIKKYRSIYIQKSKKKYRKNIDILLSEKISKKDNFSEDKFLRLEDVINYRFGINGEFLSLEVLGKKYNVSRERIRQISKKFLKKIKNNEEINWAIKNLKQFLKDHTPVTQRFLIKKLIEEGFFSSEKSLICLRNICNLLDKFEFQIIDLNYYENIEINNESFLVYGDRQEKILSKIFSYSRKCTDKYGYCNFPKVISDLYQNNKIANIDIIKSSFQQHGLFFWFNENDYYVLDSKENRSKVINTLKKLLYINEKITYETFSEALLNHYKLKSSPPKYLLKDICRLNKFKCDDNYIYSDGLTKTELGTVDKTIIKMFKENGDYLNLYQCLDLIDKYNLKQGSLISYLYAHSIVKKISSDVFCLFGTKIDEEKIELAKNYLKDHNLDKNFEVTCDWGKNQNIIIQCKVNRLLKLKGFLYLPIKFKKFTDGEFEIYINENSINETIKIKNGIIYNLQTALKNFEDNKLIQLTLQFNPNKVLININNYEI